MRVVMMLKSDEQSESGAPPTPEKMAGVGAVIGEMMDAGILLGTEGLLASSKRIRVKSAGGKVTTTDGPFSETKELIAGFIVIDVDAMEDAMRWVERLAEVQGDFESELSPAYDHAT